MQNAERDRRYFTRKEAAVHAVASARIEGIALDEETQMMLGRWAHGECSPEELDDWIEKQVRQAKKTAQHDLGAKLIG
jgi:Antitoxin VbhA